MREKLLGAALLHFQAKQSEAAANLEVYLSNPAGIGEHPNVVDEIISLTKQLAEASECVDILLSKTGYPPRKK